MRFLSLTYFAMEAIRLDFVTDTGSNHVEVPDSAATEGNLFTQYLN